MLQFANEWMRNPAFQRMCMPLRLSFAVVTMIFWVISANRAECQNTSSPNPPGQDSVQKKPMKASSEEELPTLKEILEEAGATNAEVEKAQDLGVSAPAKVTAVAPPVKAPATKPAEETTGTHALNHGSTPASITKGTMGITLGRNKIPKGSTRGDWVAYGLHPYWMDTAWKHYNFDFLTHVAFCAYQVDVNTGMPSGLGDWDKTRMIEAAHAAGCKVHLIVTTVGSVGDTRDMLTNPKASQNCIDQICEWVKRRSADGVCLDFEDIEASDTMALTQWVTRLAYRLWEFNEEAELTVVGHVGGKDMRYVVPALAPVVDYVIVVGYDFAGSPIARGDAVGSQFFYESTPSEKLVLTVPLFGLQWVKMWNSIANAGLDRFDTSVFRHQLTRILTPFGDGEQEVKISRNANHVPWKIDFGWGVLEISPIPNKRVAGIGIWALGDESPDRDEMRHAKKEKRKKLREARKDEERKSDAGEKQEAKQGVSVHPLNTWAYQNRWLAVWVAVLGFATLVLLLVLNRKARKEILNGKFLFPLAIMAATVLILVAYEIVHDLFWPISAHFPWFLLAGAAILCLGFAAGRYWDKMGDDET
jgi:Glycosyl hydrolases family 18